MAKRRFISQIPVVNQSDSLQKFFGATVDQVFQPGKAEQISGYIGLKPSYYDASRDFYVPEPTLERDFYQLEVAMVSRDKDKVVTNMGYYNDLVRYMNYIGANIFDQNRMFSDQFYSWSPPIDLDKISDFHQYYWFGANPDELPALTLTSPTTTTIANGTDVLFPLPDAISTIDASLEQIAGFVDGLPHRIGRQGEYVYFEHTPPEGAKVVVFRYASLRKLVEGKTNFDVSGFNDQNVGMLTSNMRVLLIDATSYYRGWELLPWETIYLKDLQGRWELPRWEFFGWDHNLVDVPWDPNGEPRDFWVEGVGSSIVLVPFDKTPVNEDLPVHIVTDRRSADRNPWAKVNYWAHRASYRWSGKTFSAKASRPIIEFIPNVQLFNFGKNYIGDVTLVATEDFIYVPNGGNEQILPVGQINGKKMGEVFINGRKVLFGDKIAIKANSDPDYVGRIVTLRRVYNPQTSEAELMVLVSEPPALGDVIYDNRNSPSHFDGTTWVYSQDRMVGDDPLFELYTMAGEAHSKLISKFGGNRLFGFAAGTAKTDTVLNRNLSYDAYGDIVFKNDVVTERTDSSIIGWQFYMVDGSLKNGWYHSPSLTSQTRYQSFFEVPKNLHANPNFREVQTITRGEWFDQFNGIVTSQIGFTGQIYAENNWRDTARDLSLGSNIIQNRSSLLKTMVLVSDTRFDYPDAVRFVQGEYERFKKKFEFQITEIVSRGQLSPSDAPEIWVDTILTNLTHVKTSEFPFALSGMGGKQYFVPPTPAFLGLLPASKPEVVFDDTFADHADVLIGHDGSRTPLENNWRDAIWFAYETLIYNSIPARFKTDTLRNFDEWNYIEGRNRTNALFPFVYSRDELVEIYTPFFMQWATKNAEQYRLHTDYDPLDPFTWNYSKTYDRDGNLLSGHWRNIYRWYYDTEQPHRRPWEMLGFLTKPSWWEQEYGPAPYTSGNLRLWHDLSNGYIARGSRQGIDQRFSRPDLMRLLPVDDQGNLLDPMAIGIFPQRPTDDLAKANWEIGDGSDAEELYRRSSNYAYDKAQMFFLMRPAEWVETGWDTLDYDLFGDQWYDRLTLDRPSMDQYLVHGELNKNGIPVYRSGIQQWIAEHMISKTQSPSILGGVVRGTDVQLSHKMSGFTQKDNLRVFADNFGLLPSEDTEIVLYESPVIRETTYAGLLIEKVVDGYRIVGYDNKKLIWKVIENDEYGPKRNLSLGQEPEIYEWRPNVYYPANRFVEYRGSVYKCNQSHTSGSKFDDKYWTPEPEMGGQKYTHVTIPLEGTGVVKTVHYQTVLASVQDVVDFITEHFRYQVSEGWVFNGTNASTGDVEDWNLSILEFLQWAQVNWTPGNFIVLSPGASKLAFQTNHGYTLNVEEQTNGVYSVIDKTGRQIGQQDLWVNRLDDTTTIIAKNSNLFGARFRIVECEHVLLFSNRTVFNDLIYDPLFDVRQPRLRLLGIRTTPWNGRLDAPGYIVDGNKLYSNFDKTAEDIRTMFDIEDSQDATFREHARHLVGYQNQNYFENLVISETEQFEFYQGMIQEKGTPDVFSRLTRSQFISQSRDLRFLEEWGIEQAAYGALNVDTRIGFFLSRSDIRSNPQLIDLDASHVNDGIIGITSDKFVWSTITNDIYFPSVSDGKYLDAKQTGMPGLIQRLPTAGYVRTNEVLYTALDMDSLKNLYASQVAAGKSFSVNSSFWIYKYNNADWTVLCMLPMAGTTNTRISLIETYREDASLLNTSRITYTAQHNLTAADVGKMILIDGDTDTIPSLKGLHTISAISGTNAVIIAETGKKGFDYSTNLNLAPLSYIFQEMRFATFADLGDLNSRATIPDGVYAYVDDNGSGKWAVYLKTSGSWVLNRVEPVKIDSAAVYKASIYDKNTRISSDELSAEPTQLSDIAIVDPVLGLIPAIAEKELTFKSDSDPAVYLDGISNQWGEDQVGILWWDLSTVRYLVAETDDLSKADVQRYGNELDYRVRSWGKIAPGTAVEVYEWTRSKKKPKNYQGNVVGYLAPSTPYVVRTRFNEKVGKNVTYYYFWVRNPNALPKNVKNRATTAYQVSKILSDLKYSDIPWMAPISNRQLIVGGVEQYLNDIDSVLDFRVITSKYDGCVHTEWDLLRPLDDSKTPSRKIMLALRNSLVGMDDSGRPVPDPTLSKYRQTGFSFRPRRTLLGRSNVEWNIDDEIRAARRSFVGKLNEILARVPFVTNNPSGFRALHRSTPTYANLFASLSDGYNHLDQPPTNSYTRVAIDNDEVRSILMANPSERVLIRNDGPELVTKTWSIWDADHTRQIFDQNYSKIANNFDVSVPTKADRTDPSLTGVLYVGQRVLVQNDETADGFWVVYRYLPSSADADADGFVQETTQTYRTSDFFTVVDWFAQGEKPSVSPVMQYMTYNDMIIAEGPVPQNTFVQVNAASGGRWGWYRFTNAGWTLVALSKGTIRLSPMLYDPNGVRFDGGTQSLADIYNRDGTWDFRAIYDVFFDIILSDTEINEVFFSMLHFLMTRNDNVEWAFKTSFMSVQGYREALLPTPILTYDNTDNLISYVNEVKPYRVKVREIIRTISPPDEIVNTVVTDFDFPLYFDKKYDTYRPLNINDANDLAIITTTEPWKGWYENYLNDNRDATDPTSNRIRSFSMQMRFDRTDFDPNRVLWTSFGWDYMPFDICAWDASTHHTSDGGAALARFYAYYRPGSLEADPRLLMDLYFRGNVEDGGDFWQANYAPASDWTVRGFDILPYDGFIPVGIDKVIDGVDDTQVVPDAVINPVLRLTDPYADDKHPEELVRHRVEDMLFLRVGSRWKPGAPIQNYYVRELFDERVETLPLKFDFIPDNKNSLFVFRDGRKLIPESYALDHMLREVTVPLTHQPPRFERKLFNLPVVFDNQRISLHGFSAAETIVVGEERLMDAQVSDMYDMIYDVEGVITVTVNGELMEGFNASSVEPRSIYFFDSIDPQAEVAIRVGKFGSDLDVLSWDTQPFESSSDIKTAFHTHSQIISVMEEPQSQTWAIDKPTTTVFPEWNGTFVFRNGKAMTPPMGFWGRFDDERRSMKFVATHNIENIYMWRNNAQKYIPTSEEQYHASLDNVTFLIDDPDGRQHASWGVAWESPPWDTTPYDPPVQFVLSGDDLHCLDPNMDGNYVVACTDIAEYMVEDGSVSILVPLGYTDWDLEPFDTFMWDIVHYDENIEVDTFENGQKLDLRTHVYFPNKKGRYEINDFIPPETQNLVHRYGYTLDIFRDYDFRIEESNAYFDEQGFDEFDWDWFEDINVLALNHGQKKYEPVVLRAFYGLAATSEHHQSIVSELVSSRIRNETSETKDYFYVGKNWNVYNNEYPNVLSLAQDLLTTDTQIVLNINPYNVAAKLIPTDPLPVPEGRPGAIFINGERIEYFASTRDGETMVLSQLRRGTKGTRISMEQRRVVHYPLHAVPDNGPSPVHYWFGDLNFLEVCLVKDGRTIPLRINEDYHVHPIDGMAWNISLTSQEEGTYLVLAQSYENYHASGSLVYPALEEEPKIGTAFRETIVAD